VTKTVNQLKTAPAPIGPKNAAVAPLGTKITNNSRKAETTSSATSKLEVAVPVNQNTVPLANLVRGLSKSSSKVAKMIAFHPTANLAAVPAYSHPRKTSRATKASLF